MKQVEGSKAVRTLRSDRFKKIKTSPERNQMNGTRSTHICRASEGSIETDFDDYFAQVIPQAI